MHTDPDERQGGRALTGPYAASERSCIRWPNCQSTDIENRQHVGVLSVGLSLIGSAYVPICATRKSASRHSVVVEDLRGDPFGFAAPKL